MKKSFYCSSLSETVNLSDCPDCKDYNGCKIHKAQLPNTTKGKKNIPATQQEPFSDRTPEPCWGYTDPLTGDLPIDTQKRKNYKQQGILSMYVKSNFRNDEGLRLCVHSFTEAIGYQSFCSAEAAFMATAATYYGQDSGQYKIILKAFNGDLSAIQQMVKGNPSVMLLPSITKRLIDLMNEYNHAVTGLTKGEAPRQTYLKKIWDDFLPNRGRTKKNPYPDDDIALLVDQAMQDLKLRKKKATKEAAIEMVSEGVGISKREIQRALSGNCKGRKTTK